MYARPTNVFEFRTRVYFMRVTDNLVSIKSSAYAPLPPTSTPTGLHTPVL